MMNIKHLDTVLRINGLEKTSPESDVSAVLLSSRYTPEEVKTALLILKNGDQTVASTHISLHKVFRSDELLESQEIALLLGGDLYVNTKVSARVRNRELAASHLLLLSLASLVVAISSMMLYMYTQNMGMFHTSLGIVKVNAEQP
jgi:hypothetical protein